MAGVTYLHFAIGVGPAASEGRVLSRQSALAKDAAGALDHLLER